MNTDFLIDITKSTANAVVIARQQIQIYAPGARSLTLNGHTLTLLLADVWVWHCHRRIGRHLLLVDWEDETHVVIIDCVGSDRHHAFVHTLLQELSAIDQRLCWGRVAWQTFGGVRQCFESQLGMPSAHFFAQISQAMQAPHHGEVRNWHGELPAKVRADIVSVHDAVALPMVEQNVMRHEVQLFHRQLHQLVQWCESFADAELQSLLDLCALQSRLLRTITPQLAQLIRLGMHALEACLRSDTTPLVAQTADVAVLYERWVWVVSMIACGWSVEAVQALVQCQTLSCDVVLTREQVWCGYQRRLFANYAETGWSRDGRTAIPDVMIWSLTADRTYQCLIIDAKLSLTHDAPDGQSRNDVTAYLRRIGMGATSPDYAVLVHPGTTTVVWPSGLVEVGTQGLQRDLLIQLIQRWLVSRIL